MPTNGNGTTPAKAFLEAPVPDVLLEQGRRPKVDSTREYVAGGGGGFPLVGQQVLAKGVDDLSRDLGLNVYEAMLHDSTVASAVAILITGVLSGEFQLLPAIRADATELVAPGSDRERDINLAQEIRDFCQRNIDRLNQPIKMICHELLYSMVLGCKLAEKVFEQGEGVDADKLVLKIVRTKRNAAWEFVVEPTGDVVAIRAMTFDLGQRDLPPEKFLIVSWMPRDGDPRGRSILRPAYNGWNLKINLFKHYNKYLEKFGCPTIIGVAASDAPDEAEVNDNGVATGRYLTPTEAMAQMLARLDGGSYAAIRAGSSIHPIQPNNNGNAFIQAFQLFKTEILEAILITSRSVMPARHSSKADSETAQDTVGQILLYGREMLEDVFHDQLFWQLVMINYGKDKADLYTPHVSLGAVEHQDIATVAVAYHAIGYAIDPMQLPAIDAKLGLPVRKPSEQTLEDVDGNPVGFSARRFAAFNCGTGAGGFKEGNYCQPHSGGGGGGGGTASAGHVAATITQHAVPRLGTVPPKPAVTPKVFAAAQKRVDRALSRAAEPIEADVKLVLAGQAHLAARDARQFGTHGFLVYRIGSDGTITHFSDHDFWIKDRAADGWNILRAFGPTGHEIALPSRVPLPKDYVAVKVPHGHKVMLVNDQLFAGPAAGFGVDGRVPDHVLAQAMRVLDAADRRLALESAAEAENPALS
jgi:hypothetical protein